MYHHFTSPLTGLPPAVCSEGAYKLTPRATHDQVSTLIPFNPKDEQQIGRKRHIGNDVVVLVFVSGKTPFSPISIQSQFNNAFIVVQLVPNDNQSSSSVHLPLSSHACTHEKRREEKRREEKRREEKRREEKRRDPWLTRGAGAGGGIQGGGDGEEQYP